MEMLPPKFKINTITEYTRSKVTQIYDICSWHMKQL